MDIEYIKKEKNEIELSVKNQDTAFFSLIENIASSKRSVEFVALRKEDNIIDEFKFYLKTKDASAKDVLLECVNEAEEQLKNVVNNLEKSTDE